MSYYEIYLKKEKEKRNAEYKKSAWNIEPDNGETGEGCRKYYRKKQYI